MEPLNSSVTAKPKAPLVVKSSDASGVPFEANGGSERTKKRDVDVILATVQRIEEMLNSRGNFTAEAVLELTTAIAELTVVVKDAASTQLASQHLLECIGKSLDIMNSTLIQIEISTARDPLPRGEVADMTPEMDPCKKMRPEQPPPVPITIPDDDWPFRNVAVDLNRQGSSSKGPHIMTEKERQEEPLLPIDPTNTFDRDPWACEGDTRPVQCNPKRGQPKTRIPSGTDAGYMHSTKGASAGKGDNALVTPRDNSLAELQLAIINYTFNPVGYPTKELVRFGNYVLHRQEIRTIREGEAPHEKIFKMFAKRMTISMNQGSVDPVIWCLPPSFADDFRGRKLTLELLELYKDTWMPPSTNLNYVWPEAYFPIQEALCVLDACKGEDHHKGRASFARKLADEVSAMIDLGEYPTEFSNRVSGVVGFGFGKVEGLPVAHSRKLAVLWVLNWLAMGPTFHRNVRPRMNEQLVRQHTALGLMMAPFNESAVWMSLCFPK
ncbi:hypothetical protein PIB30_063510 [Stylosanthes scabra]|uniref:Uncharacterized protein n=1 Tax=Stylosanthes scabra TaxID=79078 RepID=A0ABU6UK93_9FABA|nr:hypothetical protein [Stylosanthes scabra]